MSGVIPPTPPLHGVQRYNFAFTVICTLLVILLSAVVRKLNNRGISEMDKRILEETNVHHAHRQLLVDTRKVAS